MSSVSAVSVTTTAVALIAANQDRSYLILDNQSATVTVFIGPAATLTAATGIALYAGDKMIWENNNPKDWSFYRGALYGITAAGTADVRVMELTPQ